MSGRSDSDAESSSQASSQANTRPSGEEGSWLRAALVYRQPRVIAMLFLGFSSGLPFYLAFQTLSAWLRQDHLSRATIGMLSWATLVYSLKFLWAPIVDRLRLPLLGASLGRRRSWMLVAQLGIAASLVHLATTNPAAGVLR
ncbi:MAG: hypothetical protein ACRET2_07515, partial [Steroidobacteraceae bacterium]